MFSYFDKPRKAQNARAAAAPYLQGYENGFIALGMSVVDQKHEMQSNCPDSFYNFQNIEISKVGTFQWRWVYKHLIVKNYKVAAFSPYFPTKHALFDGNGVV